MKQLSIAIVITVILSACTSQTSESIGAQQSSSSETSKTLSSHSNSEQMIQEWKDFFGIETNVGDMIYGLTVTSIEPPYIFLKGDVPISGTLSWQEYYFEPELFFVPDLEPQNKFIVTNFREAIPVGKGASVLLNVDQMRIVYQESSQVPALLVQSIHDITEVHESISEQKWKDMMNDNGKTKDDLIKDALQFVGYGDDWKIEERTTENAGATPLHP